MSQRVEPESLVWDTPGAGPADSMPLGNGEVALNVWTEPGGDILFYLARTDAWSQHGRLLKLGRVRLKLTPNPFTAGVPFRQCLNLMHGRVEISAGAGGADTSVWVWVEADNPVVHVEVQAAAPVRVAAVLEVWRDAPRELEKSKEMHSAYGLGGGPEPVVEQPDTVIAGEEDRVTWYHRNTFSIWSASMKHQGLASLASPGKDPLLNRTFGGAIFGAGLRRTGERTLESEQAFRRHGVHIGTATAQTATASQWKAGLDAMIERARDRDLKAARAAQQAYWRGFWGRSFIRVLGTKEARVVGRGYDLQRFVTACAGRGGFPIKFNGSLFTVDWGLEGEAFDADYRRWGGPYWFQNTRLAYWPMLAAGDWDMMEPLWRMFLDALPLAQERTRLYFNHGGAFFPETMTFWGGYADENYGWDRGGKPDSHVDNTYIRWHWNGGLELLALALDRHAYTGDKDFLRDTLLPLARPVLQFFDEHHGRDAAGKLLLKPAQALETWQDVVNPTQDIAGLMWTLDHLLALPEGTIPAADRQRWQRLRGELPPLPMTTHEGQPVLAQAQEILGKVMNSENPNLYAVFPFRLLGLERPDLAMARATFAVRHVKGSVGWRQDAIQEALLGLTDEAKRDVVSNFSTPHAGAKFPAFFGPNFDWIPDQDHGNVACMALQSMLLQPVGERLLVLPAWPREWDVHFKLHAPNKTTVECNYRGGKVKSLKVTPSGRSKAVKVMNGS